MLNSETVFKIIKEEFKENLRGANILVLTKMSLKNDLLKLLKKEEAAVKNTYNISDSFNIIVADGNNFKNESINCLLQDGLLIVLKPEQKLLYYPKRFKSVVILNAP